MGHAIDAPSLNPDAIEFPLPWGPILRGVRWGAAPDRVLMLHQPGADIDAWGVLPRELARSLSLQIRAFDLPGHGLSDGPWQPNQLPELVRLLATSDRSNGREFVIAAGATALAALDLAAELQPAGLICLSPAAPDPIWSASRSPRVPKLFFASSMAAGELACARRLAAGCGGWAVVTAVPVKARSTALLETTWSSRITEQIAAFMRDCLRSRSTRGP